MFHKFIKKKRDMVAGLPERPSVDSLSLSVGVGGRAELPQWALGDISTPSDISLPERPRKRRKTSLTPVSEMRAEIDMGAAVQRVAGLTTTTEEGPLSIQTRQIISDLQKPSTSSDFTPSHLMSKLSTLFHKFCMFALLCFCFEFQTL